MKFSTIIVGALAAVASAAPVKEERSAFDLGALNGLNGFNNLDLNYLLNINALDLNLFAQLGQFNNFNVLGFQGLFNQQAFDINALLQFQQLSTLLAFQQQGLFNGFDLGALQLGGLNLGLLNNIGGLDLNQFVDASFAPQIAQIAQQTVTTVVVKE